MEIIFSLITKFLIYGIYLFSLNNIVIGKTGYWAIGHICFFNIGATITGLLSQLLHFNPVLMYLSFMLAPILSVFISIILSIATSKLKGDFFIFISISLAILCNVASEYLSGPSGFSDIVRPAGLSSDISILFVSFSIFIVSALYILNFNKHPLNNVFSMIRTNEKVAISLGINVFKNNRNMFILGGALASISGVLFAYYSTGTDPQRFNLNEAVILYALAVIGGIDTLKGTILASAVYVLVVYTLDSVLSGISNIYSSMIASAIFGLILVSSIMSKSQGLFSKRKIN